MTINVQNILIQLFEDVGYHREKQVRIVKLGFATPAPGTYRFDKAYNRITSNKKAYLTTKTGHKMLEFFVDGTMISVLIPTIGGSTWTRHIVIDLADPESIDELKDLLDEHS